jgi:hypothetical protein
MEEKSYENKKDFTERWNKKKARGIPCLLSFIPYLLSGRGL